MTNTTDICRNIAHLAKTYLDLEKWGFKELVHLCGHENPRIPSVIYESDLCKMRISFSEWHPPHQTEKYTVDIYYGRLSAPNDKRIILFNNEECYCWHELVKALHFLDGASSEFTANNLFAHEQMSKFREIMSAKDLAYGLPEWEIRKHQYIWERYAPRIFELYDTRRPELWEQYRRFLKTVYDIRGRNPNIKPPLDHVC